LTPRPLIFQVCISLLGTWDGEGSELWGPGSTLLQVLLSIQGLILTKDPYYNEPGNEKHRGSADAAEAARTYNEMALIKTVQSMRRIVESPPRDFRDRVESYFKGFANVMLPRLEKFASNEAPTTEFPIAPTSRGFRLAFAKAVQQFKDTLSGKGYLDISSEAASTAPSSSQD
ncbi:unnamed protein product, partial [Cyprideis torosa]